MFLNVLIRFQVTMCESELLIPLSRFAVICKCMSTYWSSRGIRVLLKALLGCELFKLLPWTFRPKVKGKVLGIKLWGTGNTSGLIFNVWEGLTVIMD